MRPLVAIAKVTFLEIARQKIVFLMGFLAVFLVLITLLLSSMSLDERLRITIHLGFGSIQIMQVFLAIFLGSTLWSRELDRRTLFTLLSRPVSRHLVFWSKYFGMLILLAHFQIFLAILHAVLIREGVSWTRFVWAHLALFIESLCILSVTMSLSVVLRPALVIATAFTIWLGGYWQNEISYFATKTGSTFFALFADVSNYIFPRFVIGTEIRSVYFLTHNIVERWGLLSLLHIFLYSLIFLSVGEWLFSKKDLA